MIFQQASEIFAIVSIVLPVYELLLALAESSNCI
jgi:hypothetical protein